MQARTEEEQVAETEDGGRKEVLREKRLSSTGPEGGGSEIGVGGTES